MPNSQLLISRTPSPHQQAEKLNPHVSVDCVVFGFNGEDLRVLLIDREQPVVQQDGDTERIYVLPGNLIRDDETLDLAAGRVLRELTSLENIYLEQFGSFGDPDRLSRAVDRSWLKSVRAEPDARVITVAYYSLIRSDQNELHASSFARQAFWHPVQQLPELGFDHRRIIEAALEHLKFKIKFQPVGFELLPEKFTLGQLQKLYEAILGTELDKRNFRRKILKMSFLTPLSEKQKNVPHKPAQYYKFDRVKYQRYKANDFYFTL